MKKTYKTIILCVTLFCILFSLIACYDSGSNYYGSYYDEDKIELVVESSSGKKTMTTKSIGITEERENIKSIITAIEEKAFSYEGAKSIYYYNSVYDGSDNFDYCKEVFKVPSNKVEEFIGFIDGNYPVTSKNSRSIDKTEEYNDNIKRKTEIETELLVYEDLYEIGTVSDKLEIINRKKDLSTELKEINKSIEKFESNGVSYTKVEVEISTEYKEDFWPMIITISVFVLIIAFIIVFNVIKFKKLRKIIEKSKIINNQIEQKDY